MLFHGIISVLLIIGCSQSVLSLCSSYDYTNKIRTILTTKTNYDIYEGTLYFGLNASSKPGANPSGIYGAPYFNNYENITNPDGVRPHSTYYLRSSSALIFAGCTPPKSIYFSFVSSIIDRFNDYYNNKTSPKTWLWASLGASLNNLEWNTTTNINSLGTENNNYDSLTTVIQTADNKTYNDLHNILTQNEITSHEINLQSLPNKYIKFLPYKYSTNNINQYNHTYDTGSFLLRVALSENQNEYQQYIHTNQTIFLLHPKDVNPNNNIPNQPFDPVRRNIYSTKNVNESSVYLPIINEYEKDLINYFEITYNLTYINSRIFPDFDAQCNGIIDCGFSCIECNSNCGGDNRDGQYWQLNEIFPNYPHFYIIMGVIHTNLKQTLYSNIALEVLHDNSVSISDLDYNGSGLILPVKTNINKEYLENIFVVQLTNQELCVNEYKLPGFCNGTTGIIGDVAVMIRDYLNQNTKTRPNVNELVPPILIQFQKTK
eukprot:323098_1